MLENYSWKSDTSDQHKAFSVKLKELRDNLLGGWMPDKSGVYFKQNFPRFSHLHANFMIFFFLSRYHYCHLSSIFYKLSYTLV